MCQHIFEGRADGVTCRLCGYHMTPQEYVKYLNPSAPEEPEAPASKPQSEPMPKKPGARRKKKEATANG